MNAPLPRDEPQRLEALRRYAVLDTPPEAAFDRITRLAALLFGAPMAAISLVDAERQWIKSCCGLDVREVPREGSFCAHAIFGDGVMVVPDATRDARFVEHPQVTGHPYLRFYAGAPLRTPDGFPIGVLCLFDTAPRTLTRAEQNTLAELAAFVIDELELRRATLRLQATAAREERFRALAESLGEAVLMTDLSDVVLYANGRTAELAGWTREEMIGRPAYELLLPREEWPTLWARNERRARGIAERYEVPLLHKNGGFWWASVNATPLRDDAGAVVGTLAAIIDITESRRAAEEAARLAAEIEDQRRRLDALVASVPGVVFELSFAPENEDGAVPRCTFVSGHVEAALGYTPAEWLARPDFWLSAVHPADRERVLRALQKARREGEDGTPALRWTARDGRVIWAEIHTSIRCDPGTGAPAGLRGVAVDVTERREAQQRLAESEARYRLLADAMDDVVSLHAPDGRFLYVSPSITKLTGYTPEEIVGTDPYDFTHPEDCGRVQEESHRLVLQGESAIVEWRRRRRDGSYVWLETRTNPIYDEEGRLYRLAAISRDISERRRVEEALAYRLRLEALITRLSTDFISRPLPAIDRGIEAALEAIGIFTGADRSYVFQLEEGGRNASNTHEWCAPGITPQKQNLQHIDPNSRPWLVDRLRHFEVVQVPSIDDLPPEARFERAHWEKQEIRSLIVIPMVLRETLVGLVGLDAVRAEIAWSDEIVDLLRIVGNIFAGALERQRVEQALRERVSRLQLLQILHAELQGVLDLPTAIQRICVIVPDRLGADRATVTIPPLDPETPEGAIAGRCLGEAFPLVIEDCATTDLLPCGLLESRDLKSMIALPMRHDETPIGVLRLDYTQRTHWFAPGEVMFLSLVAEQLGIVLRNAQLFTERARALNAAREAEEKYRSIFENATEGIFQSTPDGRLLSANPALARLGGYASPEEMIRSVRNVGEQLYADGTRRHEFLARMQSEGRVTDFEMQAQRKDGALVWVSQNTRAVRDPESGALLYFEGTIVDITARKAAEAQLLHDALHDQLTGLPNRTLFLDRLAHQIERERGRDNCCSVVLVLNFDGFTVVNDSLGPRRGDEILIAAARRLQALLRPGDTLARLGADEFAILVEEAAGVSEATQIAERIQSELSPPFPAGSDAVFLSASIGIVIGSLDYEQPEDLLRDAGAAMFRAKRRGRARYEIADPDLHKQAVARLRLESDLRRALERGELRVFYQPIVALATGRIRGLEALTRWQHPQRGPISPAEFIPVAEETGVIAALGRWMLGESCRQISAWDEALFLSVNISSRQLSRSPLGAAGLPGIVEEALAQTNLEARRLHLEITESALLENDETMSALIAELHGRGVHFAMDDFGTGYSALSYLHRFPIALLKIDRSFIGRLGRGDGDRGIVEAIVGMARSLNIGVVAEGVESAEQLALLRELGCEYGQGYLFAPPLPPDEMAALLARDPRW